MFDIQVVIIVILFKIGTNWKYCVVIILKEWISFYNSNAILLIKYDEINKTNIIDLIFY